MAAKYCDASGRGVENRRGDDDDDDDEALKSANVTDQKSCMTVAERLRLYRERQAMIQRRGIETLKEMDARAEDFRRKQQQDRRRKLNETRTREEEQRAGVEERRRKLLEEEHERRLLKLKKLWEMNRMTDESRRRKRKKAGRLSFGSGAMSDGTLSSGGRTPTRPPRRPHSIAGQTPSYALPTIASQIRAAHWTTDYDLEGRVITICYRCRSVSPSFRQRSRSAEPVPRSSQSAFRAASSEHSSLSRDDTATLNSSTLTSRPIPRRTSRSIGSNRSFVLPPPTFIPTLQKPPGPPSKSQTPEGAGSKPERRTEPEVNADKKEERRRSSEPNRKCQVVRRRLRLPVPPSSEFRMFSFRHQDGTASVAVARGTKVCEKSKVEAFKQTKTMRPIQRNDSTWKRVFSGETGRGGKAVQVLRQRKETARPQTARARDDVRGPAPVAMEENFEIMETDLVENGRAKPPSGGNRNSASAAANRSAPAHGTRSGRLTRPSTIPVPKMDRPSNFPSERRDRDKAVTSRQRHDDVDSVTDGGSGVDIGWAEDGATSETVSTSLEQFLDDSISWSENAEDLDVVRKPVGRRDIIQLLPVSHLLRDREDLLEGDEETVEIYEEFEVVEEVEVRRGDATELTITLEKLVTEETLEFLCPDPDDGSNHVHRASVSSI